MKKVILLSILALLFVSSSNLFALSAGISLFVDSAPNVYGSPDWDPWWAATKADVVAGTFTNMRSGINPNNIGTTNFKIQDEVVYSFGDLGKRLHWIYWIPGATVEDLGGNDRFQVSLTNIWDGDVLDFYTYYYGSTWLEPTKWENYNGGVIGSGGMAWWGAYGTNTQAALDADIAAWGLAEESWIFTARLAGVGSSSITSYRAPIPEPSTVILLGFGLIGMIFVRRLRNR